MRILVDTDFLVALAKADDSNHSRAFEKAHLLREAAIFITPFIVPEAATVLSCRVSHKTAKLFLEEARKQDFSEIILDREIVRMTDALFFSQMKKGISWIDCFNVSAVRLYKLHGILSFDSFYKKCGVRML